MTLTFLTFARAVRRYPVALLAGLLLALALVGCGATTAAKTTPDANALLRQASQAGFRDATYTLAFTITTGGQTVTGTGSGKLTREPKRFDVLLAFPITAQGKTLHLSVESITDLASSTSYQKISGIPGVTPKWTKTPLASGASLVDVSDLTDYETLENAKVVGVETIDGMAAWHIQATQLSAATPTPKGTKTPTSTASVGISNVDIYVRQDNSYPIRVAVHTTGAAAGDITLTFTKFDSGVTIDLPKL